jgi:hypothetical protein
MGVCICMHACIIHTHTYIYVYICIYNIQIHIILYIYTCVIRRCILHTECYTHTHTHTHTQTQAHSSSKHAYTNAIHTYIYTHIHTPTRLASSCWKVMFADANWREMLGYFPALCQQTASGYHVHCKDRVVVRYCDGVEGLHFR